MSDSDLMGLRIALIGPGSLGRSIVEGLHAYLVWEKIDCEVIVAARRPEQLEYFSDFCYVRTTTDFQEAAELADILILTVSSSAALDVARSLPTKAHLVIASAGVSMERAEAAYAGRVTRAMPAVTACANRGTTLMCHGSRVDAESAKAAEGVFQCVGRVKVVDEAALESLTALTGSSPALYCSYLMALAEAASRRAGITKEEAVRLATESLIATALMMDDGADPEEVIGLVATKGGLTEKGLKVQDAALRDALDRALRAIDGGERER